MHLFIVLPVLAVLLAFSTARACNKITYAGCSSEDLRAIQQQQFMARNTPSNDAHRYWRDRQYVDRVRSEDRNHELELERLRSETAVEVAKQRRRSRPPDGYYIYRPSRNPPVVVEPYGHVYASPKPVSPGRNTSDSSPDLKGQIHSRGSSYKRVRSALK